MRVLRADAVRRFYWPGIAMIVVPLALLVAIVFTTGTSKGYLAYLTAGLYAGRWLEAWDRRSRVRLGLPPPIEWGWRWPWRRTR